MLFRNSRAGCGASLGSPKWAAFAESRLLNRDSALDLSLESSGSALSDGVVWRFLAERESFHESLLCSIKGC